MISKIINFSIYLLRYFSILRTKYEVSSEINFGSSQANNFFKKNLEKCEFFLEYGSGNSTLLANKLKKKFISIEADKSFFNYIRKEKEISDIKYVNIGPTKYFSYPILPYFLIQKKVDYYCKCLNSFFLKEKKVPDLILIDGRYRSMVTLNIIRFLIKEKIRKNVLIIIDDYKSREKYKILTEVISIDLVGRFGVIKFNNFENISIEKVDKLINKVDGQEL
tara:strand:+ start:81 stop:743 length:663 start_codon:yes stop_codon:yes gene_type:complete